jgi:hypothetical protein
VGTWKLNLARSTYPIPAPLGLHLDGSESPVTGNPNFDAAVFKSTETGGVAEYKKDGKVVSTTSSTVSDDGRTMTVSVKVPAAQGKEITIVSVYDRQ